MTPAQLTALRAACLADPGAQAFYVAPGNAAGLLAYLNGESAAVGWRSAMPTIDILNTTNQSRYTPNDSVAQGNTDTASLLRLNARALYAQTKLMVFQNFVQFRSELDMRKVRVRADMLDCLTNVPAGAAGALVHPGNADAAAVLSICVRPLTRAELMLASQSQASDTTGTVTGRVTTFEGAADEIEARALIFRDDGTIWS